MKYKSDATPHPIVPDSGKPQIEINMWLTVVASLLGGCLAGLVIALIATAMSLLR